MTGRERVKRALAGLEVPRLPRGPLAVHVTAVLAGIPIRKYSTDPRVMADCISRYHEAFRPDAIWVSADTWVTAEAMGVPLCWPGDDENPTGAGELLITSPGDLDSIPSPDPSVQGRMPVLLEALQILRKRYAGEVFIVGCFDQAPFSLACALAGLERTMVMALEDRPFLEAILDRCVEYATAYGLAMARAGADMLSTGDAPAGLLGPGLFGEVAAPATRRVFSTIREKHAQPLSLHICGRATPILEEMVTTGCDVVEIDHLVGLDDACRIIPPEIAIWGNLDTVELLLDGTPDKIRAAVSAADGTMRQHGRRRFVLSSGCTLPPGTPPANISALLT